MEYVNPVAAQANSVPNGTAVADLLMTSPPVGGMDSHIRRLKNLPGHVLNWIMLRAVILFMALTAGAIITHLYPHAPWVVLGDALLDWYKEQ